MFCQKVFYTTFWNTLYIPNFRQKNDSFSCLKAFFAVISKPESLHNLNENL